MNIYLFRQEKGTFFTIIIIIKSSSQQQFAHMLTRSIPTRPEVSKRSLLVSSPCRSAVFSVLRNLLRAVLFTCCSQFPYCCIFSKTGVVLMSCAISVVLTVALFNVTNFTNIPAVQRHFVKIFHSEFHSIGQEIRK